MKKEYETPIITILYVDDNMILGDSGDLDFEDLLGEDEEGE